MEKNRNTRNRICFGFGTIGRDMFYAMVSMFALFYISDVLNVHDATLALVTTMLVALRLFDAFNDPIMGLIVDNTRSQYGKFKPSMLFGALVAAVCMILMFSDMGLLNAAMQAAQSGASDAVIAHESVMFVVVFGICYVLWDISYGLNDVAYWSMMPALSTDQKERERIGSLARICANVGLFALVVGIEPITEMLGEATGSIIQGWFIFALVVALLMIGFQAITLVGVKEPKGYFKEEESTSLLEMFRVIIKNDQLLWVAVSMSLFMIGYMTTTSFGLHFFTWVYGDKGMYSIFAAVLGISQLSALAIFTQFSKHFNRRTLYTGATILVVAGYLLFFFSPTNMLFIGAAGILIFVGQAFIQMLMLMFLTDTIEYGQLKLGKRNESITFSIQPLINKLGGAIATGMLGFTLILSGINAAETPADVTAEGVTTFKVAMLLLPLIVIVIGYFINMKKFKIDEERYSQILADLEKRGDITINN